MKEDEKRFLIDTHRICTPILGKDIVFGIIVDVHYTPRDMINSKLFYMHYKRAWYLLEKWSSKGWYDYGVTLDLGWLTDKGKEIAQSLL